MYNVLLITNDFFVISVLDSSLEAVFAVGSHQVVISSSGYHSLAILSSGLAILREGQF